MTLIVLAAGLGSRFGGLKQLTPVGPNGEFIIDYTCHDAVAAGFDHIVFVIKEENYELFRETIGKRVEPHVKVSYVFQKLDDLPEGFSVPEGRVKPWGTAHALLACRNTVIDNFATVNADDYYGPHSFVKIAGYMKSQPSDKWPAHFCMSGYMLSNTLSPSGTVSRGVCQSDSDGKLVSITERVAISQCEGGGCFTENENKVFLPGDTRVSMNLFGATPMLFAYAYEGFKKRLANMENPLKNEYFLPAVITDSMADGLSDVKLIDTEDRWFGVTYKEDLESVRAGLAEISASGTYRSDLWSDLQ